MPELIVRKWDGPYSFMIFREHGVYKARRGDTGEVQFKDPSKSVVIQNAINSLLQGGTIFLKEVQLPSGLSIPTNVLIVEDYQGVRSFYTGRDVYPPAVETANYTIFKDGALVKARSGQTGEVEFSDEDAAAVVQDAINALTDGGIVWIKGHPSRYEINSTINIKRYIRLIGEGTYATRLENKQTGGEPLITFQHDTYACQKGGIANLELYGNASSGDAIQMLSPRYMTIRNVIIDTHGGHGIVIDARDKASFGNRFFNLVIGGCGGTGVYIKASTGTSHCNNSYWFGGRILECDKAIHIEDGYGHQFFGYYMQECTYGLHIDANRCLFIGGAELITNYQVLIDTGAQYNIVIGKFNPAAITNNGTDPNWIVAEDYFYYGGDININGAVFGANFKVPDATYGETMYGAYNGNPSIWQGGDLYLRIYRATPPNHYFGVLPRFGADITARHGYDINIGEESYPFNNLYIKKVLSTNNPPLNLAAQSSPPASPSAGDIYLDDGTNTADGNPHLRYYDGAAWHDL